MGEGNNNSDKGFWSALGTFFGSISLKIKLILGTILGVFGLISYFLFKTKVNNREILELELKKVREEIEIEKAQEEIDVNNLKLDSLEKKAEDIVKQIEAIEKPDAEREVSKEELDDFFDKRGF